MLDECNINIEGLLCYVCMKGVFLVISPRNASGRREKKNGVGMALDVATLPLILYCKVYVYPLSMYYIARTSYMHIPTLFYYFAIPTPFFFSFPMFFLLVYNQCIMTGLSWSLKLIFVCHYNYIM